MSALLYTSPEQVGRPAAPPDPVMPLPSRRRPLWWTTPPVDVLEGGPLVVVDGAVVRAGEVGR